MEQRERGGIIFLGERHLAQRVGRRAGKFALRIIVENFLKT